MEKFNLQFLDLLKSSLNNGTYEGGYIDSQDLKQIYHLSEIHHVLPMIYSALHNEECFKNTDEEFKRMFKQVALRLVVSQIQRSNRFLELYKILQKENIEMIVNKLGYTMREFINEYLHIKKNILDKIGLLDFISN